MPDPREQNPNEQLEETTLDASRYGLVCAFIGSNTELPISAQLYNEIGASRNIIVEALLLEQKFELLIANHLDFEKALNDLAAETMLHRHLDYAGLQNARILVNQRTNNLLSACRGYLDHADHHIGVLSGLLGGIAIPFNLERNRHYDTNPHFALAEAMRNHAQHRGFVLSGVSVGGERVETDSSNIVRHAVRPMVDVQALLESPKTKPHVKSWLEAVAHEIDARPVLRAYVAAIADIHDGVREAIKEGVSAAEKIFEQQISAYRAAYPLEKSAVGLAAVRFEPRGTYTDLINISENMLELRRALVQRNSNFKYLPDWHVSSEPSSRPPRRRKSKN